VILEHENKNSFFENLHTNKEKRKSGIPWSSLFILFFMKRFYKQNKQKYTLNNNNRFFKGYRCIN